jgi:hypothetical protein
MMADHRPAPQRQYRLAAAHHTTMAPFESWLGTTVGDYYTAGACDIARIADNAARHYYI